MSNNFFSILYSGYSENITCSYLCACHRCYRETKRCTYFPLINLERFLNKLASKSYQKYQQRWLYIVTSVVILRLIRSLRT